MGAAIPLVPLVPLVEVGPGDGEPVLVLHGGPGETHHCLRPHLDRLATGQRRRRVVYFDQRGGELGWRDHVADIEAVRRQLGAPALTVCGFSWGSLLALLHAVEHPGRVARLLLVSPPAVYAGAGRTGPPPSTKALAELRARLARVIADSAEGDRDPAAARRARFALKIAPYFADPARATLLEPVDTDEAAAKAVTRSLGDFDLRPRLAALRGVVPSLVVRGVADPLPAEHATSLAALLGARLVLVDDAGHAPFVEAPDAFFAATQQFLDRE